VLDPGQAGLDLASAPFVHLGELDVVEYVILLVRAHRSLRGGSVRWIARSTLLRAVLQW
jgi:hypothetical protein